VKTTGATFVAGRTRSALISASSPSPDALPVATAQPTKATMSLRCAASATKAVDNPDHASAAPAATVSSAPRPRPRSAPKGSSTPRLRPRPPPTAKGSSATAPSAPSTSASLPASGTAADSGGATAVSSTTPTAIPATAPTSRAPTASPSRRAPIASSSTSPKASAGCTTTSGARVSAYACNGHPRQVSSVPSSQRRRRTNRNNNDTRSPSAAGASRASSACTARPTSYSADAPHAASAPMTTEDIILPLRSYVTHPFPALTSVLPALRPHYDIRDRLDDPHHVALTFDDGPDPRGTPAALKVLDTYNIIATFFVTGEQVRDHPSIARETLAAGHHIGLHGDRHRNLLRVGPRALADDLRRAATTIADTLGVAPTVYRPPYGVLSAAALRLARAHAWETILWTRWGRDWRRRATPTSIATELTRDLQGGEILLLHDADRYSAPGSWRATVIALPAIAERIRARGLEFASGLHGPTVGAAA
jgi:peptidoglycan-N-acetylglucosamine deacetylase